MGERGRKSRGRNGANAGITRDDSDGGEESVDGGRTNRFLMGLSNDDWFVDYCWQENVQNVMKACNVEKWNLGTKYGYRYAIHK